MKRPLLFQLNESWRPGSPHESVVRIVEAGFDGVEFVTSAPKSFLHDPHATPCPSSGDDENHRPINAVATSALSTDLDRAVGYVDNLLTEAGAAGAKCLSVTLPAVAESTDAETFRGYQDALNFAYQLLHRLRHQAERTGVALALEAATNGCLLSPVELRELIRSANSWAVGACIDLNRVARVGRPDDWITTLSGGVHAIRVEIGQPNPLTPSGPDGAIDLATIGRALDDIHYDRAIIVRGIAEPVRMPESVAALLG